MSVKDKGLDLTLSVDADFSRTKSVVRRSDGGRTLKTVTSLDEMVSLGKQRRASRRKTGPSDETDSGKGDPLSPKHGF